MSAEVDAVLRETIALMEDRLASADEEKLRPASLR